MTIPHTAGGTEALSRVNSSWGRAGGWDYGTLCGILVGGANTIDMATVGGRNAVVRPMLHQLFEWYQNPSLPDYTGNKSFYDYLFASYPTAWTPDSPGPRSTLCHDSVTQWCVHNNETESSPLRSNRCGLLTGECAYVTARLLCYNAHFGTAPSWYTASTVGEGCKTPGCHITNVRPFVKSNCYQCHK